MNEALNKKLGEWRFPDAKEITVDEEHIFVVFESRNEVIQLLTQSLDACFKWLVPKFWVCSMTIEEGIFAVVKVGHPNMGSASQLEEIRDGNPLKAFALALCLAIEKLIDKEEPDEGNQNTNPTT